MNYIANYIVNKILHEAQASATDGTSGKFILTNYPQDVIDAIMQYFAMNLHQNVLLIVDEKIQIASMPNNAILASHEVMAQYRNENVQHNNINIDTIDYLVFITNETDTFDFSDRAFLYFKNEIHTVLLEANDFRLDIY